MTKPHIAVVGGGLAGLSAAHRAIELGAEVTLFEASARLGGLLGTERVDGFVIERAADAFITTKTAAVRLCERLGIEDRLIKTTPGKGGSSVLHQGKLEKIPQGFQLLAVANMDGLLRSPILSEPGKRRAKSEHKVRAGETADASLEAFVERRYGRELLERLAQPLAGGVYGAPAHRLSLRSYAPRFLDLVKEHGSLTKGLAESARASVGKGASGANTGGARYGLFASFQLGMQELLDALIAKVEHTVRLETEVRAIEFGDTRVRVVCGEDSEEFDGVVLAMPAYRASTLLGSFGPKLAGPLRDIEFGSSASVTLGFAASQLSKPLSGYGFVVPAIAGLPITACTYSSEKWAGRAPEGHCLVRAYLGGAGREELSEASSDELIAMALRSLRPIIGLEGAPLIKRVVKYPLASPRYDLEHQSRLDVITRELRGLPQLALAGASYSGVGMPDAIRTGEEAAERVLSK